LEFAKLRTRHAQSVAILQWPNEGEQAFGGSPVTGGDHEGGHPPQPGDKTRRVSGLAIVVAGFEVRLASTIELAELACIASAVGEGHASAAMVGCFAKDGDCSKGNRERVASSALPVQHLGHAVLHQRHTMRTADGFV